MHVFTQLADIDVYPQGREILEVELKKSHGFARGCPVVHADAQLLKQHVTT